MIILKVTKNVGFTLALEDTFFEEPHGGAGGVKLTSPPPSPSSPVVLGLKKLTWEFASLLRDRYFPEKFLKLAKQLF